MIGSSATFNIYTELPQYFSRQKKFVLATVVGTKGSAPQKEGNSALFDSEKRIAGTVGGGIVEYSIQKLAGQAITNNSSAVHTFNLTNEFGAQDTAICGGKMEILLDASPEKHLEVFRSIKDSLLHRIPGILITRVTESLPNSLTIDRNYVTRETIDLNYGTWDQGIKKQVEEMLVNPVRKDFRRSDYLRPGEEKKTDVYLETIVPLPRLVIAGAGHIGKALSHLGKMLGFEVIVWDYRSDYASREKLPDADHILNGSIDSSLAKISVDSNTYIVAVTTGHKNDTEVLKAFLPSRAGYIGMIGSRKKTVLMRERFLQEKWATKEQWEKIYAPVGLDIHSETVEEIAVSIAAQLVQVRHQINNRT